MGKEKDYINLNLERTSNDTINNWHNFIEKLEEEDGKYFKVDKDGINCELCHNLERRVFFN